MEGHKKVYRNIFLVAVGCILLYWIIGDKQRYTNIKNAIDAIISPFVFGSVVAFILNVPMRGFESLFKDIKKPGLRRILAVLCTFVAVAIVLAIVFLLLIPQLIDTVESLFPKLSAFFISLEGKFNKFLDNNPEILKWLKENTDFESFNWSEIVQRAVTILGNSISTILTGAVTAIGGLATLIMDLVIGIVFSVYCLFQKENLARQGRKILYAFLPENVADYVVKVFRLTNSTFSNFLSGQCIEVVILGSMFAVSMAIFRMPYIPLVSVLIAVTAFIPVVGAWVGCILGAFLILVANPLQAVWFVAMFLVLQQIENNMIYPRVVGSSIGLSGMWVLIAVAIGGQIMGVAGMFLMIPVVSVLYTLMREFTNQRLSLRNVPGEKLEIQPPELSSHLKQKWKKKRMMKNEKKGKK